MHGLDEETKSKKSLLKNHCVNQTPKIYMLLAWKLSV